MRKTKDILFMKHRVYITGKRFLQRQKATSGVG